MSNEDFASREHLEEHYQDRKVQETVNTITGGPSPIPNDKSKEVMAMVYERETLSTAIRELQRVLTASETRVQRVIQASSEVLFKTVAVRAGVASKVSAMGFNRTRLILTGQNLDISVGTDANITVDGMNSSRIGYAGSFFTREISTVRDIWVVAATDGVIGVQEEFVA